MPTLPRVALCVIFRDNEKTIDALLESICRAKRPNGDLVGYAFDEYVFVDTGCVDSTKSRIASAFGLDAHDFPETDKATNVLVARPQERAVEDPRWGASPRVVFGRFDWVNDFSAARNFCFDQAKSDWRMYLDTDDTIESAAAIRPTLGSCIDKAPDLDSAHIPYKYDPQTTQWVFRLVKWSAGYRWYGMIHEYLRPPEGKGRHHVRMPNFPVTHAHDPSRLMHQLERNVTIARAEHAALTAANGRLVREDSVRLGKAAYTLGEAARTVSVGAQGDEKAVAQAEAERFLIEASDLLSGTNIGSMALVGLGKLYADMGAGDAAVRAFAAAVEYDPSAEEPRALLAMTYMASGKLDRANRVLELLRVMPPQEGYSVRDEALMRRDLPLTAAKMYLRQGNMNLARQWMSRVDVRLSQAEIGANGAAVDLTADFFRQEMFAKFKDYVEVIAAADDAELIAKAFESAPRSLVDLPEFHTFKAYCAKKTRHLRSWKEYLDAYNSIPAENYTPDNAVNAYTGDRGRMKALLAWGAALPKEGPPVRVLCVGPSSTLMEREFLKTSERIHLTIAEASEFVGPAYAALQQQFPGRVARHVMREGELDWFDTGETFDFIYIFEVVEHLKSSVSKSLNYLSMALVEDGELYCSTPFGPAWLSYAHVGPDAPYDFWGHVRAHTVRTFCDEVRASGMTAGTIELTDGGSIFLAKLKRGKYLHRDEKIRVFVPGAFPSFDPESMHRKHVGGSEEAVIHLSRELAANGRPIDVFVARPALGDHVGTGGPSHLVYKDGVTYLPIEEFSLLDQEYATTIFWRCPQIANQPEFQETKGRKVLWLHDTTYGAKAADYAKFDDVLVLSDYHRRVLIETEGGDGWEKVPFRKFQNGVDVSAFPTGLTRDRKKTIYVSSPDRGLAVLLELWPKLKERVPDATLDIYYSWDLLRKREPAAFERYVGLVKSVEHLDVRYLGGVDHATLHKAMMEAGVLSYPCTFAEVSCISMQKAQVAGMRCVTTEFAALAETMLDKRYTVFDVFSDAGKDAYLDQLIHAFTDPWDSPVGVEQAAIAADAFDWKHTASMLEKILED